MITLHWAYLALFPALFLMAFWLYKINKNAGGAYDFATPFLLLLWLAVLAILSLIFTFLIIYT